MTDKEIGKAAREIAERGNTAEVKRNKDGIVILEVGKKIVKSDRGCDCMGGRGGASGLSAEPRGRQMSMKNFLENLSKNSQEGMLNSLQNASLDVKSAIFTKNGNAVKSQEAILESGENKVSVRFYNQWEPMQVGKPTSAIKQTIDIVSYKNGNATAIRTLSEKKSMSLKNAEKNYHEMLEQWKKLTKQKGISFK